MGKYGQVVMGPAGSGKSTYCHMMHEHFSTIKRVVHIVNLDPAAENFAYPVSVDIRELIAVDDVVEELALGPNGGLVFCMEYLLSNLDWLQEKLGNYDNDYVIFDCPGQIELYSHMPIMKDLTKALGNWGYDLVGMYLIDAMFMTEPSKFISGSLASLSAMIQLELPHLSILTKMDMVINRDDLDKFIYADMSSLVEDLHKTTDKKFHKLNEAIGGVIESFNLVSYIPLDRRDEDSFQIIVAHTDQILQWHEDQEVQDPMKPTEDLELPDGSDGIVLQ